MKKVLLQSIKSVVFDSDKSFIDATVGLVKHEECSMFKIS